jgi:hypothetical protein
MEEEIKEACIFVGFGDVWFGYSVENNSPAFFWCMIHAYFHELHEKVPESCSAGKRR